MLCCRLRKAFSMDSLSGSVCPNHHFPPQLGQWRGNLHQEAGESASLAWHSSFVHLKCTAIISSRLKNCRFSIVITLI
jgi:hypothetical protein